jgi:hypothetical protein
MCDFIIEEILDLMDLVRMSKEITNDVCVARMIVEDEENLFYD